MSSLFLFYTIYLELSKRLKEFYFQMAILSRFLSEMFYKGGFLTAGAACILLNKYDYIPRFTLPLSCGLFGTGLLGIALSFRHCYKKFLDVSGTFKFCIFLFSFESFTCIVLFNLLHTVPKISADKNLSFNLNLLNFH